MIGRTNVGGAGGAGNAIAYIGVMYPAGAIVTCTKGTKTLRAKDTTGLYVFPIPEIGVWTVAINGSTTQIKSVEITTLWQDEIVDLTWDGTLFDNGNQYVDYTGGWAYNKNLAWYSTSTATTNTSTINTKIKITNPGTTTLCAVQDSVMIDLTNYSNLQVQVDEQAVISGVPTGMIILTKTRSGKIGGSNDIVFRPDSTGLKTFDIESVSSNYYITIACFGTGSSITISKLKLNAN